MTKKGLKTKIIGFVLRAIVKLVEEFNNEINLELFNDDLIPSRIISWSVPIIGAGCV